MIMTTESATSPPVSPAAKRVKTDDAMAASSGSSDAAAAIKAMEQTPPLLIKKLSDKARLPTRGSAFAAGYDLYAARDTVVPAQGKVLVDTDISIAVPPGTCQCLSHSSFFPVYFIFLYFPKKN